MTSDYEYISAALKFVAACGHEQPQPADVAAHVQLSPDHLQRLFRRWVGLSPKRFVQLVTVRHAKAVLAASASALDATGHAGLSSPGQLHHPVVTLDTVTPGEAESRGRGLAIRTGVHDSPFGYCLLAVTERGICGLSFHDQRPCDEGRRALLARWPEADIADDRATTEPVLQRVFGPGGEPSPAPGRWPAAWPGGSPALSPGGSALTLFVTGTDFQVQVWRALLRVGSGQLTTYGALARRIGRPTATRAVGGAVGRNPVAWLIPCHRVISSTGALGGYGWGAVRKKAMVGWEMAQAEVRRPAS